MNKLKKFFELLGGDVEIAESAGLRNQIKVLFAANIEEDLIYEYVQRQLTFENTKAGLEKTNASLTPDQWDVVKNFAVTRKLSASEIQHAVQKINKSNLDS